MIKYGIDTPKGKYENYSITSEGDIICRNRILKHTLDERGYHRVKLYGKKSGIDNGTFRVHRLVAYNFIGDPPSDDMQVDHKNGNKNDNSVANLEWVDNDENMRRATINGLRPVGEKSGNNKYSESAMRNVIVDLYVAGMSVRSVSKKYNVHEHTVRAIRDHEYWSWLIESVLHEYGIDGKTLKHRDRHNRELMEEVIISLFIHKHGVRSVANHYGLSTSTVNNVKRKTSWRWLIDEVTKTYLSSIGAITYDPIA